MSIQDQMFKELREKKIFEQAKRFAFQYSDQIPEMDVFPSEENLQNMDHFDHALQSQSVSAESVIEQLNTYGSPATIAQTGGRYFGFVDGGAVPVALATKWLTDFWDQCGGLYLASPINAKLELVCEGWLRDIFNLPSQCVAGFVSGTSMANLCGLAAARYRLLKNQDWDVNEQGLMGAPPIRVIAHEQVHASIRKTLALLGFGVANVEWMPSKADGTLAIDELPDLDNTCLVLTQAGNVNTGAFDPFEEVCERAERAGAWVHVDGAFGLWAAATKSLAHLTRGMERANSWAVDGHKTLNTPYDSGIILCADPKAMVSALAATGDYLMIADKRDPLFYTPEMSKRARAIELWATMKYLGKNGIDELICGLHQRAVQLSEGLRSHGFRILNDVVFNQVLVACENEDLTKSTLMRIQQSQEMWCGGSKWEGEDVIRISVCSWATTEADIKRAVEVMVKARKPM